MVNTWIENKWVVIEFDNGVKVKIKNYWNVNSMAKPQHYKKHKFRYRWVGRPTKLSPEMVKKLEEAASVDATIEQMCFYACIA